MTAGGARQIQLTPKEYAAKRNISPQAAIKAIKKWEKQNILPPSVTKIEKYGRFYLLTVTVDKKGNLI